MEMTLEQYILNPMGKNNAVMNASTREIMRKSYMSKFDNILLRENGKIRYYLYRDDKSNTSWIHVKVPSETVKNFYYDVVFKFSSAQNISLLGEDLFKCNVQFYSNDPAFVYTYAYVFAKNGLFIRELAVKMSKTALKTAAKEKNPNNNVGYVKAIYFAYLLMRNKKLNNKNRFNAEAKPLDLRYLLSEIENAEEKISDREREGQKVSKRKKITVSKNELNNISKYTNSDTDMSRLQTTSTKKVKKIANLANKESKVKSTRISKSVKKK